MDAKTGEPSTGIAADDRHIETWKPGLLISIVWTLIATALTIGSFIAFLAIDRLLSTGSRDLGLSVIDVDGGGSGGFAVTVDGLGLILLIAVATLIMFAHEAIHGAAFRYYGGRPIFGAALLKKVLPVLYASAPGYTFSRGQFAVIVLAPAVVITVLGLVLMPLTDLGLWLAVPMAVNFGGAVGDFWFAGMLLTKPAGTRIEDLKDGLRFYYPASG